MSLCGFDSENLCMNRCKGIQQCAIAVDNFLCLLLDSGGMFVTFTLTILVRFFQRWYSDQIQSVVSG